MTTTNLISHRRTGLALACSIALSGLTGCGGYAIDGRVVQGPSSVVTFVAEDDPRLTEPGVGSAKVIVQRDPDRPTADNATETVSDSTGRFQLSLNGFGAGWMEEQWLIRAGRRPYPSAEARMALPGSMNGRKLLIMLGPPGSGASQEDHWDEDYHRQLERYR